MEVRLNGRVKNILLCSCFINYQKIYACVIHVSISPCKFTHFSILRDAFYFPYRKAIRSLVCYSDDVENTDMKFNVDLTAAEQEYLENQYKEYVKSKNMTSRERTALREWVADGNSVYNNPMGLWKDGFHPAEFLEVYRDEEYIEEHTQGMSVGERNRYAAEYYGFSISADGVCKGK